MQPAGRLFAIAFAGNVLLGAGTAGARNPRSKLRTVPAEAVIAALRSAPPATQRRTAAPKPVLARAARDLQIRARP